MTLVDAANKPKHDARWVLGRDLVAAWNNYLAGNSVGGDDGPPLSTPQEYIDAAIEWLKDNTTDGSGDIVNNGDAVKQNEDAWKLEGSDYHSALDEYNNFGTIDGVPFALDADAWEAMTLSLLQSSATELSLLDGGR